MFKRQYLYKGSIYWLVVDQTKITLIYVPITEMDKKITTELSGKDFDGDFTTRKNRYRLSKHMKKSGYTPLKNWERS